MIDPIDLQDLADDWKRRAEAMADQMGTMHEFVRRVMILRVGTLYECAMELERVVKMENSNE